MELREYLRIIFAHRNLIVFLTLVTVVVATIGGFSKQPVYETTTTILIKSDLIQRSVSALESGFAAQQNIQRKGETFGKILKSRVIAEKVVNILGLDKKLGKKKLQKQKKQSKIASLKKDIISTIKEFKNFLKYGKAKKQKPNPRLALIQRVQGSISTALFPKTSMITIAVLFSDPQTATDIANTAASVFVNHIKEMNTAEARASKEFIAERVEVAREDLRKAQNAMRQFIVDVGVVDPEEQTRMVLGEFIRFKTSLMDTKVEILQTRKNLREIKKQLTKYDKNLKSAKTTTANPLIQDLKKQLIGLEIKRSNLSVDFGPLHPKIIASDSEINKIKTQLKSEVKRIVQSEVTTINPIYQNLLSALVTRGIDLSVFREKEKAIAKIIVDFPNELKKTAEKQIEWDTLLSATTFAQKNLDSLKEKLESARISEAQKISEIMVIDPALPPVNPKGLPKAAYTLIGLIVGLMGGIGMAFFLEYIDDSIKTIETVEEELKLPVYGVIPEIKPQGKMKWNLKKVSLREERLITHFEPRSPIAEAYRSFRTNIQFAGIQEKNKVILITSSLKGEGKTTSTANLSITMAQLGSKTIVIDADMRNPMIHPIFGIRKEPGLSNYLGGFATLNKIIKPSGIENLDIIPTGPIPPNPSELLSSGRLSELIDNLKDSYDFILFDSPPIIAVTDAVILSSKVHGVFLVIKGGETCKRICLRAKALLDNVNANVLGAVLNVVKVESRYDRYYQHYYYGPKKRKKKKKKSKI